MLVGLSWAILLMDFSLVLVASCWIADCAVATKLGCFVSQRNLTDTIRRKGTTRSLSAGDILVY